MPNRDDYFLTTADVNGLLSSVPTTYIQNSRITPLVGPRAYYTDLRDSLNLLGTSSVAGENAGQFIFINNWTLGLGDNGQGGPFSLAGIGRTPLLRDILVEKAQRGVDVRIMGWVSGCVFNDPLGLGESLASEVVGWNRETLESIYILRQQSGNRIKACVNTLNHPRGSVHCKLVVMSDAFGEHTVGYTGGLDFVSTRHGWHDVVAKVEGPAVHGLYEFYREMWNELITGFVPVTFNDGHHRIESIVSGTSTIVDRTALSLVSAVVDHSVQSLRTIPIAQHPIITLRGIQPAPLSFAPNGIFEVAAAWRKAIQAATRYIYLEDQYFWSADVMTWLRQAVINHPGVVVILVCFAPRPNRYEAYSNHAIQNHLFNGLNAEQMSRIAMFRRTDMKVHSKTTIIDDCWAIIGSANCNNRGLYTDFDHSVSMFHEGLVRDYRIRLWSSHFQDNHEVNDCNHALHVWNNSWGSLGNASVLRPEIEPWPLSGELGLWDEYRYDNFEDPDSRLVGPGCLPFAELLGDD